jgi:hypothetical protein
MWHFAQARVTKKARCRYKLAKRYLWGTVSKADNQKLYKEKKRKICDKLCRKEGV